MTHTRSMDDSEGDFGPYQPCRDTACPKCRSGQVNVRTWDSSDGAYEDCKYLCLSCHHVWWIDGIDS